MHYQYRASCLQNMMPVTRESLCITQCYWRLTSWNEVAIRAGIFSGNVLTNSKISSKCSQILGQSAHGGIFFWNLCSIKPNMDSNFSFPIDLALNGNIIWCEIKLKSWYTIKFGSTRHINPYLSVEIKSEFSFLSQLDEIRSFGDFVSVLGLTKSLAFFNLIC